MKAKKKKETDRASFCWKISKISKNVEVKKDILIQKYSVLKKTAYQTLLKPLTDV